MLRSVGLRSSSGGSTGSDLTRTGCCCCWLCCCCSPAPLICCLSSEMSGAGEQQQQSQQQQQPVRVKSEPVDPPEDDLRPTDLSMGTAQHFRVTADFEYLRNPSELKIMKNLHTLREQRASSAALSSNSDTQPRDLSVSGAMQLSLNLAAEQLTRPQDLSVPLSRPLVKTEECDRS
uniref:Uncharacterized protein n=1 Tax=Homalodisca liturata TaxID=320908 RepID=A0A1B6K848_9HEMI